MTIVFHQPVARASEVSVDFAQIVNELLESTCLIVLKKQKKAQKYLITKLVFPMFFNLKTGSISGGRSEG